MLAHILAHARALGAQHQRDALRAERVFEVGVGIAGQPDPPEAGLGDLFQRAGEVDDARPRHALESARCGLGEDAALGRRMAVLGDDPDRSEGRGRAQDRADIMRVGDLVEDEQHGAFRRVAEHVVEPDILERLDLDHHALVRRVVRHQPAEVGDVGEGHRNVLGELHEPRGFARRPGAKHLALGIVERRRDRVPAPEARAVGRAVLMMRASCGPWPPCA